MAKIAEDHERRERERKKQKTKGPKKPFDCLSDPNFRRNISCAFKTTTRDQWAQMFKTKTYGADVGKYTPRYHQSELGPRTILIH
jgi:hypothetical protein